MKMLSKQEIIDAKDRPSEVVPVPEWGGAVRVGTMSAKQRDAYQMSLVPAEEGQKPDLTNITARLLVMCIIGEDGEPLFTLQDVEALGAKSAAAFERIDAAARRLNGLHKGAVEDAEKNSGAGQSAGSTSD